jgi:hypothetical protein
MAQAASPQVDGNAAARIVRAFAFTLTRAEVRARLADVAD